MDLSPLGKGKGGKKGKGSNFSAVQPDKAGRYAGVEVDPETGWRKPFEKKGTVAVNRAPGLDAYLLYEDDGD